MKPKLVTAYSVRNMVFCKLESAELTNNIFYKGLETIKAIVAVEFNGYVYPTNPLIVLPEKQHGNS